ncbi:MAG: NAD(P)/FAD-dependent oxidoreductase [Bacteroidota bacterium]
MQINIPESEHPRVVIIGGGFGGISLGQDLKDAPFQVVMLDKNNYHCFQPLLYQVATGGLEPDSIAFPIRKLFEDQKNFYFRMAEVWKVDAEKKEISTNLGELSYDYLVLAMGSKTNFFGNEEIASNALGMKSVPEALDLRSLILQNFERANYEKDRELKDALLNFVVVGGGPTGVETAGALSELKHHILPKDYPELDLDLMHIYLIEAGPRLLAGMSEKSSENSLDALEKMGVHVSLETFVKGYDGHLVTTSKEGFYMPAETVIWSAGITGNMIDGLEPESIERGRLKVDAYNQVEGQDHIFAIGDLALMKSEEAYPKGHPQVAQGAIQQGNNLAHNLKNIVKGAPLRPFEYFDKGSMATIGRNKAVLDVGKIHMKGFIAWMGWMFVHLLFLIGFRNKVVVFTNWVWSYFTYDKGFRLIIRPFKKKVEMDEEKARSVPA